jgi:hypothetical protein
VGVWGHHSGESPPFARFNAAPQGRVGSYPTVLPIQQVGHKCELSFGGNTNASA